MLAPTSSTVGSSSSFPSGAHHTAHMSTHGPMWGPARIRGHSLPALSSQIPGSCTSLKHEQPCASDRNQLSQWNLCIPEERTSTQTGSKTSKETSEGHPLDRPNTHTQCSIAAQEQSAEKGQPHPVLWARSAGTARKVGMGVKGRYYGYSKAQLQGAASR